MGQMNEPTLEKAPSQTQLGKAPSLKTPPQKPKFVKPRKKTPDFAHLATASFDEINRLNRLLDDQRILINEMTKEVKTLKIVNTRQEKAIAQMDKEHGDFPLIMKTLNEELRVQKAEKLKYIEKNNQLDRLYQTQGEEMNKLNDKIYSLQQKLKSQESLDMTALQKQLGKQQEEIEQLKEYNQVYRLM